MDSKKVEMAVKRLQAFEPEEGYFVAFSGGKDSQCVYHLAEMANVKFNAHYSITSCDPPELVRFIKMHYPNVKFEQNHYNDGKPEHYYQDGRPKPVTMWSLIPEKKMPPTRLVRYCCEKLKEFVGQGRVTVTGVRWAESINRKNNQGIVTILNPKKAQKKAMEDIGVNFAKNVKGGIVLNDDNDINRRSVEFCYRTNKTLVNPIIDWTDADVWSFLNENGIPHCCLYDEGFTRIGCIGCPMARSEQRKKEFERWPAYQKMYMKAFGRMIDKRKADGLPCNWETSYDVMEWWLSK